MFNDIEYNQIAQWIQEQGYEPETSMENLISVLLLNYEYYIDGTNAGYSTERCIEYVEHKADIFDMGICEVLRHHDYYCNGKIRLQPISI